MVLSTPLSNVRGNDLDRVRHLFEGFPGLHGIVDIALEGAMGTVYADDSKLPTVALIDLDFYLLAGDSTTPMSEAVIHGLVPPFGLVTSGAQWDPIVRVVWKDALQTRTRVAFQPPRVWDQKHLRSLTAAVEPEFVVERVAAEDVGDFAGLAGSLVYNFPSYEAFAARGVGFGIRSGGKYVSGCSSFALGSRSLEFEIQTQEEFRGRGLASACAAAMIEHCLTHGLKPCWDAHNEISAALAAKLGFEGPAPYTAYEVDG